MKNDAMQRRAVAVKLSSIIFCVTVLVAGLPAGGRAQVNSGSDGSDGAFNPTVNININMASRPSGVYQYTSVNIPSSVTVTFTPNANNTPVVWLVQGNCVINGSLVVSGSSANGAAGGLGGPGGYRGGDGGPAATQGQGPGGALVGANYGGNASYAALGGTNGLTPPGPTYGNNFLIPVLGGSGGGGTTAGYGGGGGGGAILIAASGVITINGNISAAGGNGAYISSSYDSGGGGSGGAIRLVASKTTGNGGVNAGGGAPRDGLSAGLGRVRFDTYENDLGGWFAGVCTQGSQFIIIPSAGQLPQLAVTSVGGVPVSPSPTGALSTPDAVLSSQQNNPIPIVVSCANLPLNTLITVSVKPMNGSPVSVVGYNSTGTLASSTATVSINMPRGGGLIYATAATSH
jgi:hypothetical protein